MRLKDVGVGDVVTITAVVVRQSPGQTLLYSNGIGESGCWSSVNSAECQRLMSLEGAPLPEINEAMQLTT